MCGYCRGALCETYGRGLLFGMLSFLSFFPLKLFKLMTFLLFDNYIPTYSNVGLYTNCNIGPISVSVDRIPRHIYVQEESVSAHCTNWAI